MNARQRARFWVNLSGFLFFGVVLVFLFSLAKELILPLILGVFFGYLLRPIFFFRGGTLFSKLGKSSLLFGVIFLLGYSAINSVKNSLPNDREKLELAVRLKYRLNERYQGLMGLNTNESGNFIYSALGKDLDPLMRKLNENLSLSPEKQAQFIQYYQDGQGREKFYQYFLANQKLTHNSSEVAALTTLGPSSTEQAPKDSKGIQTLLHYISIWLVFPLTMIFIILDRGQLRQAFMGLIPNRYFELTRKVLDQVDDALGRYIRGTLLECLLVGLTIALGMWLLGFRANVVILVGLIGGLTNAIPFVGPALAFAIGGAFALIAEEIRPVLPFIDTSNVLIGVMCVMVIAQLLDNAIYQPLVVGGAVNLHPLAVIIGVFVGSLAFGFAGLLLAIPTIVVAKVVTQTLYTGLKEYRII